MRGSEITALLVSYSEGDDEALKELLPLIYQDLKRIARNHLRLERDGHTLCTTALVHESYLNMVDGAHLGVRDRAHFFAVASRVMRNILVDHARARSAAKRGGDRIRVTLTPRSASESPEASPEMIALDDALRRLGSRDPRAEQVVTCKIFGGMTTRETAEALQVSTRTVEKDWMVARAFLHRELEA
ncbi:MAG: sigma-70 family RNA polymerase sigma factor [Gemmatimonadales bacterium]|nr:MAG: sigma-70 family RNA polymerase sigma factor [Gemmatimonadales bacterium]